MHFSPWNFHQQGIPARGIPWGAGIQLIKEQMARAAWRFSPGFSWKIDIQEVEAFQHLEGFFGGKLRNPGSGIFHQPEDVFRLLNSPSFFEKRAFPNTRMTWPNWNHISPTSLDFPENFGLPFLKPKRYLLGEVGPLFFITSILAGKLKHPQKTHTLNPPEVS